MSRSIHPLHVDVMRVRHILDRAIDTHEQVHERFFLARLLGLEFSYPDETCEVRFEVEEFLLNPKGHLHGGIVCVVLDACMGHLMHHVGQPSVTLEMKTQFLDSVAGGSLRARASILKRGRSVSFLQCELQDALCRSIAHATATWKAVR